MRRRRLWAHVRLHLMGALFFLLILAFFAVTIAIYNKAFTNTATVTVETGRIGNQMRVGGDVKFRDVQVGEVSAIRTDGNGPVLDLALDPRLLEQIPGDVTAQLKPKTLFGERYVSLEETAHPATVPLTEGDVISQDRSKNAIETDMVLNDLLPVLRAVQPQKLSRTLTAVAGALEGRGASLGETVVLLDDYLRKLIPSLPDLTASVEDLATVSKIYDKAGPELLAALENLSTTSRTISARADGLRELFRTATRASVGTTEFLEANQENVIHLAVDSRETLEVLAKYAPEYPCLIRQMAALVPKANEFVGKGTNHPGVASFTAEITVARGEYKPGVDEHVNGENRGPRCYPLPEPGENPPQYPPGGPFKDGSEKPPARPAPFPAPPGGGGAPQAMPSLANSSAETDLISLLAAVRLGEDPDDIPDWASLLLGPVYRGAEVMVK